MTSTSTSSRTTPAPRARRTRPAPANPPDPAPPLFATAEARYAAIVDRDPHAVDAFFYAVATTGIYCRPTCPARRPRPENVSYYPTPDAAERAGFRACARCRPRALSATARDAALVTAALRQLETSTPPPELAKLASGAGLSPSHFHRVFKAHVGLTPRQYIAAHRLRRVGEVLRGGAPVTAALYEAGYGSSGRFYDAASGALGMAPSALRRGGAGVELATVIRRCALGRVLIAATPRGVCAILFGDTDASLRAALARRFPRAALRAKADDLDPLAEQVVAMLDGRAQGDALPLDLLGTTFQQRVWRALRDVPPGTTVTYAELARRIHAPRAVRAVGTACGANPVAVAVPCHRVVRADGGLGGYRWGLPRKKLLLERERR